MVLMSAVTLAALWAAARPLLLIRTSQEAHALTVALIALVELRLQRFRHTRSLDAGHRHGRLGYCNKTSGRDLRWPLRKSEQPAPRRRTPPPGGM
jgi:competence protein ComEC